MFTLIKNIKCVCRDGEEELGPQQEEGDVEIEEEKEEEVGDDNSVPDDIPPPKATSRFVSIFPIFPDNFLGCFAQVQ